MKKCQENKEFFEEQYLKLRKSTKEISKEFGYSHVTIWRRLKKFGINRSISESNSMEKNGMWKGEKVGYNSLHLWIRKHKPKSDFCEKCKIRKPIDISNISGEYKRDINDFEWLCRRCHMKSDGRFKNLKGGR